MGRHERDESQVVGERHRDTVFCVVHHMPPYEAKIWHQGFGMGRDIFGPRIGQQRAIERHIVANVYTAADQDPIPRAG